MKRPVILVGPAPPLRGGIAAHTARLAGAFEAAGHDVRVLSYSRLYPPRLFPGTSTYAAGAAELGEAHLDVMRPASGRAAASLLSDPRSRVIVQWWHPVAAPVLASLLRTVPRERMAVLCHNATPHEWFPLASALTASILRRAGLVLCHSNSVASRAAALCPGARIRAHPLPPLLPPTGVSRSEACAWARVHLAIEEDAPVALLAGHLRSYKGAEVLIRAWSQMHRRGSGGGSGLDSPRHARLVIAGESYLRGREQRRLLDAAATQPSIVVENRYLADAELERLVKRADVLVAPYARASQSGLVPLAHALGTPVITSDAGGLTEQAGGGTIVAAGDVDALAAALARRLTDTDRRGREWTPEEFSAAWQRLVEMLL